MRTGQETVIGGYIVRIIEVDGVKDCVIEKHGATSTLKYVKRHGLCLEEGDDCARYLLVSVPTLRAISTWASNRGYRARDHH